MVKVKGALALSALGELYYQGYGTEKNLEKSIKSFRKASHYKFAHAQYRAGVFYLMEDNFIDNKEGIRYLRKRPEMVIQNQLFYWLLFLVPVN